jgi:hypothetical protein
LVKNYIFLNINKKTNNYGYTLYLDKIGSQLVVIDSTITQIILTGDTYTNGNLIVGGNLNTTGNTILNGNLTVTGSTTLAATTVSTLTTTSAIISGNINTTGSTILNGNLNVTGTTLFNNNITYTSNIIANVSTNNYYVSAGQLLIFVDSSVNAITLYMPSAVTAGICQIVVKDAAANVNKKKITISKLASDTFIRTATAQTTVPINTAGSSYSFFSDGVNKWYVV